jgi:Tfp pilus assembly protein PilN
MINLLPPGQKEQIRFAKLNRLALRYLWGLVVVVVVLAAVFAGAFYLMEQQTQAASADAASNQQRISELNSTFVPKAKAASDRLTAIKYVQGTQTHFSKVVADIAAVVPQGVSITSMTLTGNPKLPVTIAVTGTTYNSVLAFRNALTTSPRIANADLETITALDSGTLYQANVVVAFKPGEAK